MRTCERLEVSGPSAGPENMAADAALLDAASVGRRWSARIYEWEGPWVSLGCFQSPTALRGDADVPWVVRPTGGRAVLHGHDLTVALAVHLGRLFGEDDPLTQGTRRSRAIRTIYRRAIGPIVTALNSCGVAAVFGEDLAGLPRPPRSADCFAHVSANDVVDPVTRQKVCGCALKVGGSAVLLQASVPVGPPLVDPVRVFEDPAPSVWRHLDAQALASALADAIARA